MSGDGSNQPHEFSHPVLWTAGLVFAAGGLAWLFAHYFVIGTHEGRDLGAVQFVHEEAAKPVDHQALIADRSQAVLDRGQQLYAKNCASCHGPNGDQNMTGANPAPRNFHSESFHAEWGGGPYGFYLTLTKGYGQGMPSFTNLEPADRYAIAHFVRETWVKGRECYVAEDAPAVAAQIPQPGAAGEGPQIPAWEVEQPERLHPLMQVASAEAAGRVEEAQAWLRVALGSAGDAARPVLDRAAAAAAGHAGWLLALRAAATAGDQARLQALLIDSASGDPALALAPAAGIEAAAAALAKTAAPDRAAAGAAAIPRS